MYNDSEYLFEKKLFFLEGIGEGAYQISIDNLGSYENKNFKKITINKFDEYDPNILIDFFEIEFTHDEVSNSIELTCDFFMENINNNKDIELSYKIIYCKSDESNVQKDYYWNDNNRLPYLLSVNNKINMCIPKVLNHIYLCDNNYLIRQKQIFVFN
jgi:hypothetical protein